MGEQCNPREGEQMSRVRAVTEKLPLLPDGLGAHASHRPMGLEDPQKQARVLLALVGGLAASTLFLAAVCCVLLEVPTTIWVASLLVVIVVIGWRCREQVALVLPGLVPSPRKKRIFRLAMKVAETSPALRKVADVDKLLRMLTAEKEILDEARKKEADCVAEVAYCDLRVAVMHRAYKFILESRCVRPENYSQAAEEFYLEEVSRIAQAENVPTERKDALDAEMLRILAGERAGRG